MAQDGFGQIHVRGAPGGSLQYRLDGVQLPEGLALFSNILSPRFADQLSLITGALPAQYGLRTAGVVDITVKSGTTNPGGEASMMTGSYNWLQPALQYGGRSGQFRLLRRGSVHQQRHRHRESRPPSSLPLHDDTAQWYALTKLTALVDENTRLSFIGGGASARYQIPNVPGQVPNFTVNGISDRNSSILDQRQWEDTYFGIASLQKSYQDFNLQLSGFTRYSKLSYQPDALGDLLYNGIAPWSQRVEPRRSAPRPMQAGRWRRNHTLRGGFLVQRERVTSSSQNNALPLVPDPGDPTAEFDPGEQTGGLHRRLRTGRLDLQRLPAGRVEGHRRTLTVNFGARFDAISAADDGEPAQPARQRRLGARSGDRPDGPATHATSCRRRSTRCGFNSHRACEPARRPQPEKSRATIR